MPNEIDRMKQFADELAEYIWKTNIAPRMKDNLSFYRATVAEPASGGMMKIVKPFETENPISVRCIGSASDLDIGDTCIVVRFGDDSNAFVIGDGLLTNL